MMEIVGGILAALFVAVASGVILDWWSGWRGRTWVSSKIRCVLRRFGFRRKSKRLLIFVSAGGTCRDPMAKVIAEKLIKEHAPELKGLQIEIEGRAIMNSPSSDKASHGARAAIRELFGEDLLTDYSPSSITAMDIERADLILVMAANLLHKDALPQGKTYLFKEFFGSQGDVEDPWPDGRDQKAIARYQAAAKEIKSVMESGMERLVQALRS
jgi:protein-tyrosine-phosphatase